MGRSLSAFAVIAGILCPGVTAFGVLQGGDASRGLFAKRVLTTGLANPFQVIWGPDDYLWVTERTGSRITRVRPSDGSRTTAITMSDILQDDGPGGLLGMALDPGLLKGSGNDFVYVAHTYDADPDPQRIRPRAKIVGLPTIGRCSRWRARKIS